MVVYAADVWEESHAAYPERSVAMPCWPGASEGASKSSQKSAEAVVAAGSGRRAEREGVFNAMTMCEAMRQMPTSAGRVPEVSGEAARARTSDEALRPRHETEITMRTLATPVGTPTCMFT